MNCHVTYMRVLIGSESSRAINTFMINDKCEVEIIMINYLRPSG